MTGPPTPPNGEAHVLQRGALGMRLKIARNLPNFGSVPSRARRQNVSASTSCGITTSFARNGRFEHTSLLIGIPT